MTPAPKTRPPRFATALGAFATVLLLLALFFFSVELVAGSENFWRREYEKLGNAGAMGMSDEDLTASTMAMIRYMQGRRDSIDLDVTVNGETVSMFNDRERAHMVDVQALFLGLRRFAWGALIVGLALFVFAQTKKPASPLRSYTWGSGALLAALVIIGGYALLDFNAFWTAFHHVFFTNDLWLLDPRTSRMINMMPLELFSDVVLRVVLLFLLLWGIGAALCAFAGRAMKKGGR